MIPHSNKNNFYQIPRLTTVVVIKKVTQFLNDEIRKNAKNLVTQKKVPAAGRTNQCEEMLRSRKSDILVNIGTKLDGRLPEDEGPVLGFVGPLKVTTFFQLIKNLS